MKNPAHLILLFGLWSAGAFGEDPVIAPTVETPPVPATLLADAKRDADAAPTGVLRVQVMPGVNEIIPVALGHLNRLITPFDHPKVRTVSTATTQIDGKVVYVAPADDNPVTLYITPGDQEELALSVTLAPRRIPPREIHLTLAAEQYRRLASLQTAPDHPAPTASQRAQDHVGEIKQTFRALARLRTPPGYALRAPRPDESIHCRQTGLATDLGQALDGRDFIVLIATVRNSGHAATTVDERACSAPIGETVAVAAWPSPWLEAGETAELYVAIRRASSAESSARPSLLKAVAR